MSLNIKNPEAHALAARLATKTGETLTEAVTQALRERLARLDEVSDFDVRLGDRLVEAPTGDRVPRAIDHDSGFQIVCRRHALGLARAAQGASEILGPGFAAHDSDES